MLPVKNKIPRELFEVYFRAKMVYSDHLTLKFAEYPGPCRFAVVVAKNVSRKAVDRNLAKRRVYSIIQKNIPKIKKGCLGFFFIKKGFTKLTFSQVKEEVLFLLKKSQIRVD